MLLRCEAKEWTEDAAELRLRGSRHRTLYEILFGCNEITRDFDEGKTTKWTLGEEKDVLTSRCPFMLIKDRRPLQLTCDFTL